MIFDTHTHLPQLDPAILADVRRRAREAGVALLLNVSTELADARVAQTFSRAHETEHYSSGLHPCKADRFAAEWPELAAIAREPDCVAIGETGLDLHWREVPLAAQERSLEAHLQLAGELGRPVILHVRDARDGPFGAAYRRTFAVLREHRGIRAVLHCFSGGIAEARAGLELGLYLSFAGNLTYRGKRSEALREAAAFAPAERILVETDAPCLAPQGKRGQANEPAFVTITLTKLAELRGWSIEQAAQRTMANGQRLFAV